MTDDRMPLESHFYVVMYGEEMLLCNSEAQAEELAEALLAANITDCVDICPPEPAWMYTEGADYA